MNSVITAVSGGGIKIPLTADMLTKHTLYIGSTGSGKTTSMNVLLRDLIKYGANDKSKKMGLLIFDFKGDDTLYKVKLWAKECGRSRDVIDFSLRGKFYFDPMANIKSISEVGSLAEMIISIRPPKGDLSNYWEYSLTKRIKTAIFYMLLSGEAASFAAFAKLMRKFCNSDIRDWERTLREIKQQASDCDRVDEAIDKTISLIHEWVILDLRTKSNELSTLTNLTDAFDSPPASEFFTPGEGKKALDIDEVLKGKIVVVTMPSATNRNLAGAIGKMCKAQFYAGLQKRKQCDNSRLCGIIMDEFQLCATGGDDIASDAYNMQTIRSKRGFVVAATQGLIGLDIAVGESERELLMANFNNFFLFRSNEPEVAQMAENMRGKFRGRQIGFLAATQEAPEEISAEPENLPTGYAFVKLANGFRSDGAIELERIYTTPPARQNAKIRMPR